MAERIPIFWDFNNIKLKQAQRELDRTRAKTRQLQGSANLLSKSFRNLGTTLLATFGAVAVLAAFRNILKSLKDLEFQMSKVAAISGATSKQMVELRNNAIKVGAASKFTATEVGKLQEELARLGFTTTEILKLTDSISALAIVADRELGPTALAVAKTINAFALTASEAARVTNIMAESFANTALDLEKFEAAIRNVGPLARVAGLSLEETTAILGTFVDNGIEASKAGTDLRRILLNISKAGITLEEALDRVRFSTNKVTAAQEIFGDRAAVAGVILVENTQKVKDLNEQFSDSTREMDRMRRIMEDNLETDLKKLASAFDALIQKGSPLNDVFRNIVNTMKDWVNVLGDAEPSTKDLKDQIFETEKQITKLKKEVKEGGLGFDLFGAKATEAERFIKKLQVELINLKLELSAKEFIQEVELSKSSKIIREAFKAAFASDDIDIFIKNLEETAEKEEIIAFIRREQKLRLEESNLLESEQLEIRKKAFAQIEALAKLLREIPELESEGEEELSLLRRLLGGTLGDEEEIDKLQETVDEALEIFGEGEEEVTDKADEEIKKRKKLRQEELDDKIAKLSAERELTEAQFDIAKSLTAGLSDLAEKGSAAQIALLVLEKLIAVSRVILLGAQEKALIGATIPPPFSLVLIAAAQARQVASLIRIAATSIPQFAGFKEGVIDFQGQGTETSDSNMVRISKGESIIKASSTAKSKDLLESINSGRLNDELSEILLNNKIGTSSNEDVVTALMGVNKSIKGLPIHQTYFSDKGVARYVKTENARILHLNKKYTHG